MRRYYVVANKMTVISMRRRFRDADRFMRENRDEHSRQFACVDLACVDLKNGEHVT